MTRTTITHHDENGSLVAIQAVSGAEPLFTVHHGDKDKFEADLLYGLKRWISSHADLYQLPADIRPDMLSIELSSAPTHVNGRLNVIRFEQLYRGIPVYGRSEFITLAVVDRKDIRKISGQIIDEQQPYRGLDYAIPIEEATRLIRDHWMQQFPNIEALVRDVRKIAIPEKKIIGFIGEIGERIFSSSRLIRGTVIVDAETGDLVLLNEFKAQAIVRGQELVDNPKTEAQIEYDNIPATKFGNTLYFEDPFLQNCVGPSASQDYRMGDDTRFTALDFDGTDGAQINQFTVKGCLSGNPPPRFLSGAIFPHSIFLRFYAQDLVLKASRVFDAMDPLIDSWDHHPDVPGYPHHPPLAIVLNANLSGKCGIAPACYYENWVSEEDTIALDLPVPHPNIWVCRNASGEIVSCSAPDVETKEQLFSIVYDGGTFPYHTHQLFHELGHYYDKFNSYGILGEDLREIVPQLISLYLHRKLYPELTYTLSTLPEADQCDLHQLILHSAGLVVHPDCITDIEEQIAQSIVVTGNGYTIKAFTQAYWSLLFGVSCSVENNTLVCDQPNNLPPDYEDRWMEALLFALQMGNDQEFVEFWENMAFFIASNYPGDLELIESVRALHGLQ